MFKDKKTLVSICVIGVICLIGIVSLFFGNDKPEEPNHQANHYVTSGEIELNEEEKLNIIENDDTVGLVTGNADVKVIDYDASILEMFKQPDNVGTCIFSVLTSNESKSGYHNIDSADTLKTIIEKESNVFDGETFNITYNHDSKTLEYLICGFQTSYTFSNQIEMYSVYSSKFNKDVAYLIDCIRYSNDTKTMYIFLKEGWEYHEEAHTDDDKNVLKEGMAKSTGSVQIFFNEIHNNEKPEHYVLVMPEKTK